MLRQLLVDLLEEADGAPAAPYYYYYYYYYYYCCYYYVLVICLHCLRLLSDPLYFSGSNCCCASDGDGEGPPRQL
eukprot:10633482-Heterocapsa_arctica.AAC.1